jgi:hypothetical protein
MPDLAFTVNGAAALALDVRIVNRTGERVDSILLRCQVQIEPARRRYSAVEKERLRDLFGEPDLWSQTMRPLLWANLSVNVPAFTGAADCRLDLPCTFDLHAAVPKYFNGVNGDVPVAALFRGTVFYRTDAGLQVQLIPWDREALFTLPVHVWREVMEAAA